MTQHVMPRWACLAVGCGAATQPPEMVIAARGPRTSATGISPELTLHRGRVDITDLEAWRERAMTELATHLDHFEVEDDDAFDLAGWPVAYRRFSHRLGTADVISDQWAWLVDGLGIVLTCSVAREDYADFADLFEDVAATVDVVPTAA